MTLCNVFLGTKIEDRPSLMKYQCTSFPGRRLRSTEGCRSGKLTGGLRTGTRDHLQVQTPPIYPFDYSIQLAKLIVHGSGNRLDGSKCYSASLYPVAGIPVFILFTIQTDVVQWPCLALLSV